MLAGLDRKNCWTIAEHRGDLTPDGLQHLLARARWNADAVRDDLRDYVVEASATSGRCWWLMRDWRCEEGRRHGWRAAPIFGHGRADREFADRGGCLASAAPRGHALIDRALSQILV